jgi:trehalose 6-phosphate phosphatase
LSEIVTRPELARPVEGAREALAALGATYRLVAIVTGRRAEEVAERLGAPHLTILGLYGAQDEAPELVGAAFPSVVEAARVVSEAWVEDKGSSVAVHYRQAPDPPAARAALLVALQPIATSSGLDLIEGKMVVELVPAGRPMKGAAVERLAREHELEAVLYAGDDHADLDAFAALDRLAAAGVRVVRVAVHGDETPAALVASADLVVDGPAGLVRTLRTLSP